MRKNFDIILAAIVFAASGWPGQAFSDGWLDQNCSCRKPITISKADPTGLEGEDIAVVDITTGGQCRDDGADIRVATISGGEVPCRVLMVGPGDQARVAFALRKDVQKYYIYFGNPKASAPAKPLEIKRGLLMETWDFGGGGIKTLQQVERIFSQAKTFIGRDFRDRIFLGYNPFGPQSSIATMFTGWLVCPEDGKYTFSTSSMNASFLLVDDKCVVDNGGLHRPQGDISANGQIDLTKGPHKLTVYHVCPAGDPMIVAAWKPPSQKNVVPIPIGAFSPVVRGTAGPVECYGKIGSADLTFKHAGELFVANRYLQRLTFDAAWSGEAAKPAEWQWEFGDGQKATGQSVSHVYLAAGIYPVKLTCKSGGLAYGITNRVAVARPWEEVTQNRLDGLKKQADIVAGYDFTGLSPEANANAIVLLHQAGLTDPLLKAGEAFVARQNLSPEAIREPLTIYIDALLSAGKADRAVDALLKASKMSGVPAATAKMLNRAGQIAMDEMKDVAKAREIYSGVLEKYEVSAAGQVIREARIGMGDVWRASGEYDKAMEAYRHAGLPSKEFAQKKAILKGDFARQVEDFLRRGELQAAQDKLAEWELAIPTDKLEGYTTLLGARLMLAMKKPDRAARQAEMLLAVNPTSSYAPELLMEAHEAYKAMNQPDKAKEALQKIVRNYGESALAAKARQMLGEK
ncbi:MAG: PKD domain-containing protein [Planctomycetes bacterium]|nr:PKD domain-containing protein [Planctomycetota bacterium]